MTAAWHNDLEINNSSFDEWRQLGIGGSDAPAIMGDSPWRNKHDVWKEKTSGTTCNFDTVAMKYGRDHEEESRAAFEKHMGIPITASRMVSPSNPWLRGNFDGWNESKGVLVEIKNIYKNKADHDHVKTTKKTPAKYYAQCQHYMAVLSECGFDVPGMYYMSTFQGDQVIIEVPKDDSYIQLLLKEEKELWDMVLTKTEPFNPRAEKDDMRPLVGVSELEKKWIHANTMADKWDEKRRLYKSELVEAANGFSAIGELVQINRCEQKGAIDYKQAIADYLDNMRSHYPEVNFPDVPVEPYRKSSFVKWTPRVIC